MVLQRAERRERLRQHLAAARPTGEDDRLAAAVGDFLHVGEELFELGALAGERVEVADLLQPHHQLEDVLHGDRVAEFVEVDDAVVLGQRRTRLRWAGVSSSSRSRIDLRRHVGLHHVLRPPQDAVGRVDAAMRFGGVSGGMRSGSTNAKMLTRSSGWFSIGVPVSAQLRARLSDRTDLRRLRVLVLDPLGLVEHDHVEAARARRSRGRRRG